MNDNPVVLFDCRNRNRRYNCLNHAESEDNLRIRPTLVFSEMVVKRSADFFECVEMKKSDERNFENAEKTVKAKHKAKGNREQNVACFEDDNAKEKTESS